MNSYHVLVGPYRNYNDSEVARSSLKAVGFTPRVLPDKSRHVKLPSVTLYGTDVTLRDCIINWALYSPEATVKFVKNGNVVATAKAEWVKRDLPYKSAAVVDQGSEHGPRTMLEIQFRGDDHVLVFDQRKPVRYFTPPE